MVALKISCCNEVLECNLSSSSSNKPTTLAISNPFLSEHLDARGNKKHLTNSSCWIKSFLVASKSTGKNPVRLAPWNPRLQASRKRSLKALFSSLFLPRVWARQGLEKAARGLLYFWNGRKDGAKNRMFCKDMLSLYKSWKYYIHIQYTYYILSNLIKFGINMDIASNKKIPYHCSLALCLWWNTNISRLVHLQYYDPNRESLNWVYKPYYWGI